MSGFIYSNCQQQNWFNETPLVNQQYLYQKWIFFHKLKCHLKAEKKGLLKHIFLYLLRFYCRSYKPNNLNVTIIEPVLLPTVYRIIGGGPTIYIWDIRGLAHDIYIP
jgi:hypothetical protein